MPDPLSFVRVYTPFGTVRATLRNDYWRFRGEVLKWLIRRPGADGRNAGRRGPAARERHPRRIPRRPAPAEGGRFCGGGGVFRGTASPTTRARPGHGTARFLAGYWRTAGGRAGRGAGARGRPRHRRDRRGRGSELGRGATKGKLTELEMRMKERALDCDRLTSGPRPGATAALVSSWRPLVMRTHLRDPCSSRTGLGLTAEKHLGEARGPGSAGHREARTRRLRHRAQHREDHPVDRPHAEEGQQ